MPDDGKDEVPIPATWLQNTVGVVSDTPFDEVMRQFKRRVIASSEFTAIGSLFIGRK